ncbi:MAG: Stp1/IreP family PP2C-type Ser/Thr phosphatase [Acidobacteriota bacterium]
MGGLSLIPAKEIFVSVFAQTDVGMKRQANEDTYLIADLNSGNSNLRFGVTSHRVGDRGSLMIVSDGMGGHRAGDVASDLATQIVLDSLLNFPETLQASERLDRATRIANRIVCNCSEKNPELAGMGTTMTAVLVEGTNAYISQVGDSRAYLIRDDDITQLTRDQSLLQLLLDTGQLEPTDAASQPNNVIMQAIGISPYLEPEITNVELRRDDYLVICSDGLSNKIEPQEILEVVQAAVRLDIACRKLVAMANARGGEDNITVIIARFDGEAFDSRSRNEILRVHSIN